MNIYMIYLPNNGFNVSDCVGIIYEISFGLLGVVDRQVKSLTIKFPTRQLFCTGQLMFCN